MLSLVIYYYKLTTESKVLLATCRLLSILFLFFSDIVLADVFEVKGISVDITASTASEAKDRALKQGESQAYRSLISKLVLREDRSRIPELSPGQISNYIHDFSVSDEKTSNVRYLAKLDFRFKPDAMYKLFREFNVPFAETASKPVLILPVFKRSGATLLWDDPNPWRQVWIQRSIWPTLVPLIVPLGDLKDVAEVSAEQVPNSDFRRLAAITNRYGAKSVIIASATLKGLRSSQDLKVELQVNWKKLSGKETNFTIVVKASNEEVLTQMMQRAMILVTQKVEDSWKRKNLVRLGKKNEINVIVPISSLEDWLGTRSNLYRVKIIRDSKLILLSRQEIRLKLDFIGDIKQLVLALAQEDIALIRDEDEWLLLPATVSSGG